MIETYEQPKKIKVNETIELVKYYPYYQRTFAWYQDLTLCKQVDNIDHPYDIKLLKQMYHYLSNIGECYYIKFCDHGQWKLVGDISLYEGKIAIVICHEYQNRHIGRAAIKAIAERAKEVKFKQIEAEIYPFNKQSQSAFQSMGFTKVGEELYRLELD